jgi:hypothetical protein
MTTTTPAFVLLVLACSAGTPQVPRECVAIVDEVPSVAECRARYDELKAGLPAGLYLGFPECARAAPVYQALRRRDDAALAGGVR